ncbi:MAG: 50S ribosomal protein L23 [bacterium]
MTKAFCDVLIRPLLTERSVTLKDRENRYSFEVNLMASKPEIRGAVEKLFKVKVRKVCTSVVMGKMHRMGRFEGKRPDWKKAIVTLEKGQKIDVAELS